MEKRRFAFVGAFFYIDIEGKKEAGKKSRRNLERFAGDFWSWCEGYVRKHLDGLCETFSVKNY